jgi:hypothetical protein
MKNDDKEFREYAEKVFPYRVDTMWDTVDDWIKYGDMFIKLRMPDESDPTSPVGWSGLPKWVRK